MTPKEQAELDALEKTHAGTPVSKPGYGTSALAGGLSGATGGLVGMSDWATNAQQANPVTYGAGYTAGTAATLPLGGALLKGGVKGVGALATKSRAITEAGADLGAAATEKAFPKLSEWMANKGGQEATANALRAGQTRPAIQVPEAAQKIITGKTGQSVLQGGLRVPSAAASPDQPQQAVPPAPAANAPASKVSANTPTFGSLADWLAEAKASRNPEVQSTADQSLEALASANDPAANRLIAMNLQQSKVGRAVGNEDSPVNEEDDQTA